MDQIGNYRILQKLGEGGMGEVFKGVDTMLEREVAIKVLRPELSQREDVLERFHSEAVALGRLNHPNIATVYSFSRDGERYYMALEFVNGEGLDKLIAKRGRIAWPDAVRYACAALEGLEHAHRLNVIHRDVKPANILIAYTGAVKIMDFGIARILERARHTRQGFLVGTLEYMSPEQIQGLEVDARSDIYSLGMVLYEMLTGRLPFVKNTDYDLLKSQIEESPPPPHIFAPDIPPVLENIVLTALAKKPDERFNSAQEFLEALHQMSVDRADRQRFPSETRLVAPGVLSHAGIGGVKNIKTGRPQFKVGELLANYPIPALAILVFLLGLAVLFFLSKLNGPADSKRIEQPEAHGEAFKKQEPPLVHEKESTNLESTPQSQNMESKKAESIVPKPSVKLPAIPMDSIPVENSAPESPPITRKSAPPDVKQDAHKPESKTRRPVSTKVPIKPKSQPVKSKASHQKPITETDEDADFWRSIDRNSSERKRSKPAPRPKRSQEDENADYWRNIDRKTSEFLNR